jgi:muconolactone delta-isomerase
MTDNDPQGLFTKSFFVRLVLPEQIDEAFIAQIPANRRMIERLMLDRIVLFFSVKHDRSEAYLVVRTDSEQSLKAILAKLPMHSWVDLEINELDFVQAPINSPQFSLN